MVNTDLLRGKIAERRTCISEISEKMGLNKATFYRRMADGESFTIGEAKQISEILQLTSEEAIAIFFSNTVA